MQVCNNNNNTFLLIVVIMDRGREGEGVGLSLPPAGGDSFLEPNGSQINEILIYIIIVICIITIICISRSLQGREQVGSDRNRSLQVRDRNKVGSQAWWWWWWWWRWWWQRWWWWWRWWWRWWWCCWWWWWWWWWCCPPTTLLFRCRCYRRLCLCPDWIVGSPLGTTQGLMSTPAVGGDVCMYVCMLMYV